MPHVTLKDVAAHAGVSHQTVSNVLNNHPSIRPSTRERVLSAVQALDYHPNAAAKALREARITTLCFAFYGHRLQEVDDPYRNLLQAAFTAQATERGYSVSTAFVENSDQSLLALRQRFLQRQFDGLVLSSTTLSPQRWDEVRSWGLKAVLLDHTLSVPGACSISADYQGGMRQLVAHHAAQGRRRLALMLPLDDQGSTSTARREGFLQACAEVELDAELIGGAWSFSGGEQSARARLAQTPRPDALLCASDRMAAGALRAAHDLHLSVPLDLALSGFDDFEFAQYTTPSLTTVRVPHAEMARQAVETLLDQLSGHAAVHVTFPTALVVRESA